MSPRGAISQPILVLPRRSAQRTRAKFQLQRRHGLLIALLFSAIAWTVIGLGVTQVMAAITPL